MLRRMSMAALAVLSIAALPAFAQTFPSEARPPHRRLCARRHRRRRRARDRRQARDRAWANGRGGEPRRRERRDRRDVCGQCTARRAHTARWADRRDGGQSVLDEGAHLRSAGAPARRAATVVPLALAIPGKAPYATMAEMFKAMQQSRQAVLVRLRRHRTPGHFAGEYLSAKLPGNWCMCPTRARDRRSTTSSAAMSICIFRAFRR